jgi:hypothetical protein
MMMILLLSFISTFEWYPLEEGMGLATYDDILNSEAQSTVNLYGGKDIIAGFVLHLGKGIFEGGEMVVLPDKFKVSGRPRDLILVKRHMEIKNHKRFAALYKGSKLKREWEELKEESAKILGVRALERAKVKHFNEFIPEMVFPTKERLSRPAIIHESETQLAFQEEERKMPQKRYFSFILVTDNGKELLIPVLLHLNPILERARELANLVMEGRED